MFSNEKLNTSTVPFISYLMPKIVPKTTNVRYRVQLSCTVLAPLESTPPHEPKLYPPTKVKTTDKYTSTQKYKIQKCRTEYRIKKQIEKILEIIYWGAGHPHRSLQNPESRIQNTTIQALQKAQRTRGIEFLSFIEFF